jgi:hypothetical protein
VTLLPQYKAFVSERPAQPALPPLERSTWTFFNASADTLAGANDPTPEPEAKHDDDDSSHPWRRPLALSITGGLLILGMQLAASGPRPPWSPREPSAPSPAHVLPASSRDASPATATVTLASSGRTWDADNQAYISSAPAPVPAAPTAPLLPAAPRLQPKALLRAMPKPADTTAISPARTVSGLVRRWAAAQDSVRDRLESGIRVARLGQLFATGRMTPTGGVTETRMSLAGMANFVRIYRLQQAAVDRVYQDSFTVISKQHGWTPAQVRDWYAKPSARESPGLVALTSSLIEGIDSLFGVLNTQAGTYTLTKNTIRFEDPGAAREYTALRQRIAATVDSAKAAGGAEQPGPMSYMLQANGTTRLPVAI